jgi:hypothetical protein
MKNSAMNTTKKRGERVMKPVITERLIKEEDIRRRAFEIYLEDEEDSSDLENWLRAERELLNSND